MGTTISAKFNRFVNHGQSLGRHPRKFKRGFELVWVLVIILSVQVEYEFYASHLGSFNKDPHDMW
jgi:hypothetical protein